MKKLLPLLLLTTCCQSAPQPDPLPPRPNIQAPPRAAGETPTSQEDRCMGVIVRLCHIHELCSGGRYDTLECVAANMVDIDCKNNSVTEKEFETCMEALDGGNCQTFPPMHCLYIMDLGLKEEHPKSPQPKVNEVTR